ncbi:MAG TPA: hypothetical protein VFX44_11455 [Solirubrobacterales bacterium]|nr:hypothetical protein [Solirubrobacterales bacterium]
MLGDDLKMVDGAAAGAWIEPRLGGEFGAVTLQVPKGFEAYARILHPAHDPEGRSVRWAEVAEIFGTTAHGEMQWHAITGSPDPCAVTDSKWRGSEPGIGDMELDELDALCEILAARTADPDHCLFGLCTIQRWEEAFSPEELKPFLHLPVGRDHIVVAGPLSAVDQVGRDRSRSGGSVTVSFAWKGEGPPPKRDPVEWWRRDAPNLIWPADHSWLVASEVDFDSTLVGGSAELIEAIAASPELEAWAVEPTTSLACDADKVNGAV